MYLRFNYLPLLSLFQRCHCTFRNLTSEAFLEMDKAMLILATCHGVGDTIIPLPSFTPHPAPLPRPPRRYAPAMFLCYRDRYYWYSLLFAFAPPLFRPRY